MIIWKIKYRLKIDTKLFFCFLSENAGMKLDRRIEEAVPAGQQLQELGMRLRCDDASSDQVINEKLFK